MSADVCQGRLGESEASRHQMNHLETLLETFQWQDSIYLVDIPGFFWLDFAHLRK